MKLVKYIVEIIVAAICSCCAYYLCSTVDTWTEDNTVFYILAIGGFIGFAIVLVCDTIESVYNIRK